MYRFGPGYSRKGTLESNLKNLLGVRNFLDHLEGGSKIVYTLKGVGQKIFARCLEKFGTPTPYLMNTPLSRFR